MADNSTRTFAQLAAHLRKDLDSYVGEPPTAATIRTCLQAQIDAVQSELPPEQRTKLGKITQGPDGSWNVMILPRLSINYVQFDINLGEE